MKRLGMFTGTVYPDDVELGKVHECCLQILSVQAKDEKWMAERRIRDLIECAQCRHGCQLSRGSSIQAIPQLAAAGI